MWTLCLKFFYSLNFFQYISIFSIADYFSHSVNTNFILVPTQQLSTMQALTYSLLDPECKLKN